MTIQEAFELADKVHRVIIDEGILGVNYLALECLGTDEADTMWAASFDVKIQDSPTWYENDEIGYYSFVARATTPAEAVRLAASKLIAMYIEYKENFADYDLSLEVKADA